MRKASTILLLVGAILAAVGAFFMLFFTLFFSAIFSELSSESGAPEGIPSMIFGFYGLFGLLGAAGSVCGFVAWRKASNGDLASAFVWGLVASLLPPLNIVMLLGAIFAKVCPEAEAQARAPAAPQAR